MLLNVPGQHTSYLQRSHGGGIARSQFGLEASAVDLMQHFLA